MPATSVDPETHVSQLMWQRAIKYYNENLAQCDKERIPEKSADDPASPTGDRKKFLEDVERALKKRYGPAPKHKKVYEVLKRIEFYVAMGDLMIQHQPHITALVWGSARLLFQVALEGFGIRFHIAEKVEQTFQKLNRCGKEAFVLRHNPEAFDAVVRLQANTLHYLLRARAHCQRRQRSPFRGFTDVFQRKLASLWAAVESADQALSRHLQTHEAAEQDRFRTESHTSFKALESQVHVGSQELQRQLQMLFEALSISYGNVARTSHRDQLLMALHRLAQDWSANAQAGLYLQTPHPRASDDTCCWIENHPTYEGWLANTETNALLWITGVAGIGKTVLGSWLAKRLAESTVTARICFRSGNNGVALPQIIVLAAISQLLRAKECVVTQLGPVFWGHLRCLALPTHLPVREIPCPLLFELLTEVLRLLPSSVLVFDGLDECDESPEADELFDFLLGLKTEPTVKTKILLLSQRTPFLEHRFQDSNNIVLCARTMSEPLRVYLHKRTETNEKLQPLKSDIVRTVHEGSQGLFLWASLMVDSLEDADSIIQQRRLLQEPPRGLIEMYQERLNNHQKTLPDDHIRQRDEIFLLLAGHPDHVGLDTICEALFLDTEPDVPVEEKGFFHPAKQVKQICGSFVDVCGKDVQFSHSSARQFIERLHAANGQNPYEYLLRISLRKLREPHYRDWRTCLRLLWENIFGGEKVPKELDFQLLESALYDHACLNWHTYATRLSRLPEDVVDDFRSFLVGNEFVTWSENLYVLRNKSGFEGQLNVVTKLRDWYATLDPDTRPELPISTVFIGAHENLSRDLENVAGNVLARFLPLMRLGRFLNLGARSFRELQQDLDYKTVVAEGFLRHLGPRNPMTLQAQLAMYADYLWKGPYDYALDRLQEVYELQRDVLGQDSMELLGTRTMIAGAYYRLGQLRVSAKILREVLDTLLVKVGDTSKDFLAGELFLGQVNEIAGNVEEATRLFHDVEKKWVDKNGKTSLFAAALFTGFGSVYRRQSNFEDSEGYLLDAWSQRYRIQTTEHPLCVDSALQLAILFRDANKPDMTKDFLDQVSNSSVFEMSFERVCQRTHVVACLAFDAGEYEEPRNVLQALIMQSTGEDREKNNRELLWVRLNLAEAMRRHDEADAALMLFTELVTPVREDNNSDTVSINTLHDEPEPAHQLEIAETALQLTRDGRSDQADSLLQQKGLAWVRTQDFWIIFGGPMADTATMRLRPPADVKGKD